MGTFLVAQWLRLGAPNVGHPGSILGQGAETPHAATKMPQQDQVQPNK